MKKNKKRGKKRLIFLVFILICSLVLSANASKISYGIAKKYYDEKNFEKSLPYFELAIAINPDDLDYYYYYAKALDEMPLTYDVQKKLFALAQNNKAGAATSIASRELAKYRQFILTHVGANYIQQVPYQDKILRWDTKTFPLKVFIEDTTGLPEYYIPNVRLAFASWYESTGGLVSFEFVDNAENADLDFRFINKDNSTCQEEGCQFVLAYALPTVNGNKLKKFDIRFSIKNNNGNFFDNSDIYLASMHEIGHTLGIMGHSFYEENLMYPSNVEENPLFSKYKARGINIEDLNTLRLLYAFKPDITNGTFSQEELSKLIFPPVILGSENEINNKKLEQAKRYVEEAPNLPNGYMDMAAAYYELGNYQEAVANLDTALSLTYDEKAKFPILYNMTLAYYEGRDYDTALIYAQMALNINNSTELNALAAYLKFKLGNKSFSISELKTILKNNPTSIEAAQYLIKAYIEDKKYNEAGKVLKDIKKANPDANDDPRIMQFGILNAIYK
ncbi:matrixin family metalloprotease [bacterium]|nr:matrixin family metalloprotease [bacterium]